MRGITNHFSPGEAALKSIQAGSDILLISPDASAAIHYIVDAVKKGKLGEERINRSALKLLTWKFRKGLFQDARIRIDQLSKQINLPQYESKAREIARESITLLSNRLDIVPVHSDEYASICAVALADDRSGDTGQRMARMLRRYHPSVRFHTYDRRSGAGEKQQIRRCARQADLLVIGSFIYVKTHQDITLNLEQRSFIESLSNYQNPEVLISFGNPYIFEEIPHAEVDMQAWAPFDLQVDAAVEALFGASPLNGTMPIRFPGHFEKGDGQQLSQTTPAIAFGQSPDVPGSLSRTLRQKFTRAVGDSLFPGAILAIMENGRLIYNTAFGYQSYQKEDKLTTESPYPFVGLDIQLGGMPLALRAFQDEKLNADFSLLSNSDEINEPQPPIYRLLDPDRISTSTSWDQLRQAFKTENVKALTDLATSNIWQPMEMRNTRLRISNDNSDEANVTLHSNAIDLSKLVFSLRNRGSYKKEQIFSDSLSNQFLNLLPAAELSSNSFKLMGAGHSRIWISNQKARSVFFLVPSRRKDSLNIEAEKLEEFRNTLIKRIQNGLQDGDYFWTSDQNDISRS